MAARRNDEVWYPTFAEAGEGEAVMSAGAKRKPSKPPTTATGPRRASKTRKFYIVTSKIASRASGYKLQNPPMALPPLQQRGLSHYPEVPIFHAASRVGRLHWDLEVLAGYWFISDRMKSVIERVDLKAFTFLRCKVRSPDGADGPVRWLCDVVSVVDALDEEKSDIRIRTSSDGSRVYNFSVGAKLVFKEDAVGSHHVFRMMYYPTAVICDETMKLACKAADLTGLRFIDTTKW